MNSEQQNGPTEWLRQDPPKLPPGYDKHHIVFLEAVHVPLAELSFEFTIDKYLKTETSQIAERIKPATIVISNVINVKPSDMDNAPNLQLLAVMATGMGWVDKEYCAKRGISVVNAPSANIDAVSEHFLALYLATRKRIGVFDQHVKTSDEWQRTNSLVKRVFPDGLPLGASQETLGIMGYGALGKNIQRLAKAIGFKEILITERRGASQVREGRTPFEEVIERSSTIVLVLPREPDTVNLIDEAELKAMRKEAIVINIARGGIVNEAALAKALREGWIFGAAADVLDTEPGGPGSTPLLPDLSKGEEPVPNLLITPHTAWVAQPTLSNLRAINRDGMTAYVEGRMYDPKSKHMVAVHDGKIWK
ncbi:hypothetical protein CBER1_10002 [Cercospora berteroae]|uniref:D-isomer specific 2-hydroxyacid dehydrogenase NAD-binding domain-containing protein n=1 Tax=Cercospora berteroae TaxID=357750 RepID=A0A2S6CIF3_9PEZI|nr:hypothetical protein CBER1_10002 [Cercospora berteroae]